MDHAKGQTAESEVRQMKAPGSMHVGMFAWKRNDMRLYRDDGYPFFFQAVNDSWMTAAFRVFQDGDMENDVLFSVYGKAGAGWRRMPGLWI